MFFFILIGLAFAADKVNGYLEDKRKSMADKEAEDRHNVFNGKKQ